MKVFQNRSRRMALPLLGGGAVLSAAVMSYGAASPQAPNTSAADHASMPAEKSNAAAPATNGFRPSEFPGVMVRSVPSKTSSNAKSSASGQKGWIYVKPGAPLPQGLGKRNVGPRVLSVAKGRSAAGGTVMYLNPNHMPYARAERQPDGQIVMHCEQNGKVHSMQEHMAHAKAKAR